MYCTTTKKIRTGIFIAISILFFFSFKEDPGLNNFENKIITGADYFLKHGIELKDKGKIDSSLLFINKARTQYHALNNFNLEINCLYYLGCIKEQQKDNNSALQYFTEANDIIIKHKISHPLQIEIIYKIGRQYFNQDKFKVAYRFANQAIPTKTNLKSVDSTIARTFRLKGVIEYYKGDYTTAILSLQQSVEYGNKAFGAYSLFVSDQVNNLGVMNFMIGRVDEALAYYQQSESIMKAGHISSPSGLAGTYTNIGLIFKIKNDFENALMFYNKALEISIIDPARSKSYLANTYINIASVYRSKKDYSKEFENLDKAMKIAEKDYPVLVPKIFQQLAIYYTEVEDYKKAEAYYEKAINKSKLMFSDNPDIAYYYMNYGQFQAKRRNFPKCLDALTKGLPLSIKFFGDRHTTTSNFYLNISALYLELNQVNKALDNIQRAIIANCKDFCNADVFSLPDADQSLSLQQMEELLNQKAIILKKLSKTKLTTSEEIISIQKTEWATHHLALRIIDKIRMGYMSDDSRLFLSENEQSTYNESLNCALNLYQKTSDKYYIEQAFVVADKMHASSLLSTIKEKELPGPFKQTDTLLLFENKLKKDLSFYQELLVKEKYTKDPDTLKVNFWTLKTTELTVKLEQLLTQLKKDKPAWYQYKYQANDIQLLNQTQHNLKANEALLEYCYSDSTLYSFCIDNNTLTYKEAKLPSNFEKYIEDVLSFVQHPKVYISDSSSCLSYRKAAWKLYDLLIKPYESIIKGKKLILIPFEKLSYVPFEALLTKDTKNQSYNFKELPYLIKQHTVRYVYAANILNIKRNQHANGKMAAFAPSYSPLLRSINNSDTSEKEQLQSLEEATKEVEAITIYFPGKVYTQSSASEENFKKYGTHFGTLHLAMHTIIDDESPLYSRLVFTAKSSAHEDDLLYTYEIQNLNLNADLVVLSACNTGVGKLRKGEGAMSLTRSFAFAGVPSIVMTLWSVNDNSSSNLMKSFYKSLSSGNSKDIALQQAKLEYLNSVDVIRSHPYYWAGYVLIGDNAPLKVNHPIFWIGIICFAIFISLLLARRLVYRKKKST